MRGRVGLGLIYAAIVASPACRDTEVSFAAPPDPSAEYFFFVALDRQLAPSRASPVFGTRDGAISFGGRPLFELKEEERGVLIVSFSRAQLTAIHGGFDPAREVELGAQPGIPPTALRSYSLGDSWFLDAALPEGAAIAEATAGRFGDSLAEAVERARTALILTFPIDPDYCRGDVTEEFTPFGDRAELLPRSRPVIYERTDADPDLWRTFIDFEPVDRDVVLAVTNKAVVVVRRGRPISLPASPEEVDISRSADYLPLDAFAGRSATLNTISIDRRALGGPEPARVLVSGKVEGNNMPKRGTIWELAFDAAGLRFVATATIDSGVDPIDASLDGLMHDPSGNAVAVAERSTLLVRVAGTEVFIDAPPIEDGILVDYRRVISTGEASRPHLICEDSGSLFIGNALTGNWSGFHRPDRANDRKFSEIGAAPGGGEYWAVGPKGTLFRAVGEENWKQIIPVLPPRFFPCAGSEDNEQLPFTADARAVAIDPRAAFIVFESCGGFLRLRRSDLCASVVTIRDVPLARPEASIRAANYVDGVMFVAGENGMMYSLHVGP